MSCLPLPSATINVLDEEPLLLSVTLIVDAPLTGTFTERYDVDPLPPSASAYVYVVPLTVCESATTDIVFELVATNVSPSTVFVDVIVPSVLKFVFLKFQDVEAACALVAVPTTNPNVKQRVVAIDANFLIVLLNILPS